ncbi:MAG: ribosomal protein S19 family protein [Nanoarchaeota archaeon]
MDVEVKSREEKYRGTLLAELKKLDVRASAAYLPSRSRRSVLRHFELIEKFIRRCEQSESHKKKIRTHLREMVIVPHLVGKTIGVHNGKTFEDITIVVDMVGHRLGEFAPTRKKVAHSAAGIGATKGSRALKK